MKKRDLAALMMIGVSAALLIGGCQQKQPGPAGQGPGPQGQAPTTSHYEGADQKAFVNQLSSDNQKKFNDLDPKRKQAAVDAANQDPNHDANKAVEQQYSQWKKEQK